MPGIVTVCVEVHGVINCCTCVTSDVLVLCCAAGVFVLVLVLPHRTLGLCLSTTSP
jgi:hypothetical protein